MGTGHPIHVDIPEVQYSVIPFLDHCMLSVLDLASQNTRLNTSSSYSQFSTVLSCTITCILNACVCV